MTPHDDRIPENGPLSPRFAAELLDQGARAYASYAATLLFDQQSDARTACGPGGFQDWQEQLGQIVRDLGVSLRMDEPSVFASQIRWLRGAFVAREVPTGTLRSALESLRDALEEELPGGAWKHVQPVLEVGMLAIGSGPDVDSTPALNSATPEGRLGLEYLSRLLAGDRRGACGVVLRAADGGFPIRALYLSVLAPVLEEIGRMWHLGEASIAEEHFATDTTQGLMAILAARAPTSAANGRTVLVTAAPGNTHDMAARVAADFFEMDGWRAICLGADIPAREIAGACVAFAPDLVAISAMMPAQLPSAAESIAAIGRAPTPRPRILVGGRAFSGAPHLHERVGADAYAASVEEACVVGRRLVGLPSI